MNRPIGPSYDADDRGDGDHEVRPPDGVEAAQLADVHQAQHAGDDDRRQHGVWQVGEQRGEEHRRRQHEAGREERRQL
jgi:hypothetical protein